MKIYGLDQHLSGALDFKQIWEGLGHVLHTDSLSYHSWVVNKPKLSLPYLENSLHRIIDDHYWDFFYEHMAATVEPYDAFYTFYPPAFTLLYRKFNKPIICVIPIRYNHPFYTRNEKWKEYDTLLCESEKTIFVANNILDQKYFEHYTGRTCEYIPSLCDYTGANYKPERSEFLIYDHSKKFSWDLDTAVNKADLGNHQWTDIAKFYAVVHFPYQFSTMSMFEQWTMGMPVFVPSKKFLLDLYRAKEDILSNAFWTWDLKGEFSWDNIEKLLDYADYYNDNFHTEYFESKGDMEVCVANNMLVAAAAAKAKWKANLLRESVPKQWDKILKRVEGML